MKCVYALQLVSNKYYVGSTYDIYSTLRNIFTKKYNKDPWLKQYAPLYVDKVVHNCEPEDEYKYLVKYIREYGVDNVRGPLFDSFTHEREALREIREKIEKTKQNM